LRRYTILIGLFLALVVATRLPLIPGQIFSYDDINLVYSMDKLDIRLSQPQPPGYPLFVGEMHVLRWLRFVRPESNLIALSILGSVASLVTLVWCGDLMFGGRTGLYGALLLLLHPSFWYAGLTSALRVQLALISAVVAGCCWRAWKGERRWSYYGALALGLGAGIRPEVGPLLFPLWVVALWRGQRPWAERAGALLLLVATVLCWLVPLVMGSGGIDAFVQACLGYLVDQSASTSTLFGLDLAHWTTTLVWLVVWTVSGLIFLPMLRVLARGCGERIGGERWFFFVLWVGPSLVFAGFVHVADPGHTLAMVAAVCLFMGHAVSQSVAMRGQWGTPTWNWVLVVVAGGVGLGAAFMAQAGAFRLLLIVLSLAAAVALRYWAKAEGGGIGPVYAAGLVLLPCMVFFTQSVWVGEWYSAAPPGLSAAKVWSDVHAAFYVSSYDQVREIVNADDAAIRTAQGLVAESPGATVVWERHRTSWRKLTYYLPEVPVVVLEGLKNGRATTTWHRSIASDQQRGPGPLPIALAAGSRVIWFTEDASSFTAELEQKLPVVRQGPLRYVDLPRAGGSAVVGDLALRW